MMGVGIGEMVLLAGIALVVIGPEKFPDFAKIVVRTMRDLRGYVDDVKNELAVELKPLEKEMRKVTREANEAIQKVSAPTPAKPAATPASAVTTATTAGAAAADVAPAASPAPAEGGAYSPETDQDFDHTVSEAEGEVAEAEVTDAAGAKGDEGEAESADGEDDDDLSSYTPPVRLDG